VRGAPVSRNQIGRYRPRQGTPLARAENNMSLFDDSRRYSHRRPTSGFKSALLSSKHPSWLTPLDLTRVDPSSSSFFILHHLAKCGTRIEASSLPWQK
ncbi:uncharacterized protein TrAFT101_003824, partial [Trichoderma asperellum]|uniref:uncharacterized protein n=1 Tax=Trichoderma asperellum TaxID=101201 RepID=UPI00331DCEF9